MKIRLERERLEIGNVCVCLPGVRITVCVCVCVPKSVLAIQPLQYLSIALQF